MKMFHIVVEKISTIEHRVHERVTKVHVYGGTAGMLFFLDTAEGHVLYGVGVMVLAIIDLREDNKPL